MPRFEDHEAFPRLQPIDPVTIPFTLVTQEPLETVAPAAPLILRLLLPPMVKLISPVDAVPRLRVCLFVVPMLPNPSIVKALLPELAEMEAVGVPLPTFLNAKIAEAVLVDPKSRSLVSAAGASAPVLSCQ